MTRIVTSSHADLRLVIVGGLAVLGTDELMKVFPVGGASNEMIDVPLPTGENVRRVLRIGVDTPFSKALHLISQQFAKHGLPVAPLWEAD